MDIYPTDGMDTKVKGLSVGGVPCYDMSVYITSFIWYKHGPANIPEILVIPEETSLLFVMIML